MLNSLGLKPGYGVQSTEIRQTDDCLENSCSYVVHNKLLEQQVTSYNLRLQRWMATSYGYNLAAAPNLNSSISSSDMHHPLTEHATLIPQRTVLVPVKIIL